MYLVNKRSFTFKVIVTIFLSVIFAVGIVYFLEPSHLIALGLTGITQLISAQTNFSFGVIYFILNIPGIVLSYFKLGKKFTSLSLISVLVVTLCTEFLPVYFPFEITNDRLVNCLFAACIMGFSLGGILKIGASSGGFDFYCLYLFEKFAIPFSYVNIPINILIVLISTHLFGVETALFSIIYIIIREIILNVFYTNNKKLTVWIIGNDLAKVDDYIHKNIGRGTSIFTGVEGGYTHANKEVIMVVLNVVQFAMLKDKIYEINPDVFIVANKTYDIIGNYRVNK